MTAFSVQYDDREVRRELLRLQERTGNLRPAFVDIGEECLLTIDEQFETETDPYGQPWTPLSAYTLSWKQSNSRILKTLQSTGRLRASITYQASKDQVVVGSNVSYARKHQLGIKVPVRLIFGVGSGLRQRILMIVRDHIMESY